MIVEHIDTQYSSIIITTVCTVLAFIFGIICGVIAYCCLSALRNRKNEQSKASSIYDEVIDHRRQTGITNTLMELNRNVAYRQPY